MDKKLPLPKELRNIPKGYIYLGNGAVGYHNEVKNFKVGKDFFEGKIVHFYNGLKRHTAPYNGVFGKHQLALTPAYELMGDAGSGIVAFYFVKADSEIAKLNGHKPRIRKKKTAPVPVPVAPVPEVPKEPDFHLLAISVNLLVKDNEGMLHPIGYAAGYPSTDKKKIKIANFTYELSEIGPSVSKVPCVILRSNEWTSKELGKAP